MSTAKVLGIDFEDNVHVVVEYKNNRRAWVEVLRQVPVDEIKDRRDPEYLAGLFEGSWSQDVEGGYTDLSLDEYIENELEYRNFEGEFPGHDKGSVNDLSCEDAEALEEYFDGHDIFELIQSSSANGVPPQLKEVWDISLWHRYFGLRAV